VADCGNILLVEPNTCCAAIHAGWRGAKSNIIEKTAEELTRKGAVINSLHAYIGPMIQRHNYEVGAEFANLFDSKYLTPFQKKFLFDLKGVLVDQLQKIGIAEINDFATDTYSSPDKFYSFRRDGETGRMSAYIMLL